MGKDYFDVIIVGGGVIGSAIAYYLKKADRNIKLAVVERDPTYEKASTTVAGGNVRIQFNMKENVQISQYGQRIFETFDEDMVVEDHEPKIGWLRQGNLILVDEKNRVEAEELLSMQKQLGCDVDWVTPKEIKERYPLYNLDGVVGGTFSPFDGTMDPYTVLMAYKKNNISMGSEYIKDEVKKINTANRAVIGVSLASGGTLTSGRVINCAGVWAAELAETAGVRLPIIPIQRQAFLIDPKIKPEKFLPVTAFPDGLGIKSEGDKIIIGETIEDETIGFDFSWDRDLFMNVLWPKLAKNVPAWDTLKLIRGWSGLYAVNKLDANAILGEWPELNGFYLANGFSGHGFQQAPAVGRYLTEILLGRNHELDLSMFGPERILNNQPLTVNTIY